MDKVTNHYFHQSIIEEITHIPYIKKKADILR
ncbi:unnamed protein product, partial [Rotaria magnacalcarata]